MRKINRLKFIVWLATMIVLMIGVYAVFTATNKKEEDAQTLKRSLAEQQKALHEKQSVIDTDKNKKPADNTNVNDNETKEKDNLSSVTMIGDSVMLGSSTALQRELPSAIVDAKESRQIWDAPSIINQLETNHKLGDIVVIGLGTNSPFSLAQGQKVINILGKKRKVFWVNVFGPMEWTDKSNQSIMAVIKANKNVKLIDWYTYASGHDDWFYSDGIHLKPLGAKEYAKLIMKSISE